MSFILYHISAFLSTGFYKAAYQLYENVIQKFSHRSRGRWENTVLFASERSLCGRQKHRKRRQQSNGKSRDRNGKEAEFKGYKHRNCAANSRYDNIEPSIGYRPHGQRNAKNGTEKELSRKAGVEHDLKWVCASGNKIRTSCDARHKSDNSLYRGYTAQKKIYRTRDDKQNGQRSHRSADRAEEKLVPLIIGRRFRNKGGDGINGG